MEAGKSVYEALKAAKDLADKLCQREKIREEFSRHVQHHKIAFDAIFHSGGLLKKTEPIQYEYLQLVRRAAQKIGKYRQRGPIQKVVYVSKEADTIHKLKGDMDSKLALLNICTSATPAPSPTSELQEQTAQMHSLMNDLLMRMPSAQRSDRLDEHMQDSFLSVASAVTTPSHTSQDVAEALSSYNTSEAELRDEELGHVGKLSVGLLQHSRQPDVQKTAESLAVTGESLERAAQVLQKEAWRDLEGVVEQLVTDRHPKVATVMAESDLLHALQCSEARLITAVQLGLDASNHFHAEDDDIFAAVQHAVVEGVVAGCGVLHLPYCIDGPLRPVKLQTERSVCTCTMSEVSARACMQQKKCKICFKRLDGSATWVLDETLLRVIQAERKNMEVPVIDRADLQKSETSLGRGGEGAVYEGRMRWHAEWRVVAIKEQTIPTREKDKATLRHVATTTYLASDNAHVCKMFGVSWSESNIWLVMEKCSGSLIDIVNEAEEEREEPGMAPIDVAMLGLMMVDALKTVHRFARSLHGDIKPANIMLAPAPDDTTASPQRPTSCRLIDFGMAVVLPTRMTAVTSQVSQMKPGTPGYAAPEAVKRKGSRASDIYSLGATLVYALTNMNPYAGATDAQQLHDLIFEQKQQMPIDADIQPPQFRDLLHEMTKLDTPRISLEEVRKKLLHIVDTLAKEGAVARFLYPRWGISTIAMKTVSRDALQAPASAQGGKAGECVEPAQQPKLRQQPQFRQTPQPVVRAGMSDNMLVADDVDALRCIRMNRELILTYHPVVQEGELPTRLKKLVTTVHSRLGHLGVRTLGRHLAKLHSLSVLDLRSNDIGDAGAKALGPHLAKLTSLAELNLNVNNIGDSGAKELSPHLAKLTSLTLLSLGSNSIGDAGAISLGPHLAKLTPLTFLNLSNNSVGDAGATALGPHLAKLTSLTLLDLGSNCIRASGAKALLPHLAKLPLLMLMGLNSNNIPLLGSGPTWWQGGPADGVEPL